MTSAEIRTLPTLAVVPSEPPSPAQLIEPRLGLSRWDAAPIAALVTGDVGELVEDARRLAESLVADGSAGRVRILARCVGAARAQQRVLEQLLARTLQQRDQEGFALVDRALRGAERRLVAFTKMLAEEESRRRPTVPTWDRRRWRCTRACSPRARRDPAAMPARPNFPYTTLQW
jgi:hypothetical protein